MIKVIEKLHHAEPGWQVQADVVVIGSGVAGLSAAINARKKNLSVLLLTKDLLSTGSTAWAQGGIAAALGPKDSPIQHLADTLEAGAGLCDQNAVKALVEEGSLAIKNLISLGTVFDLDSQGNVALTREGGHRQNRIAHAGGDATGAEISRALVSSVLADPMIQIFEHALVLDLLKDKNEQVCGVTLHVMGEGLIDGVGAALGRAVVIATGGLSAVFEQTTNPLVATGDGVALALRAGASVADLEFIQFHPTVLWVGEEARGSQPLISEAVRGEGAILLNEKLQPFMQNMHPMKDLAPRDVVAHAVVEEIRNSSSGYVWLDGRKLGEDIWRKRFPNILASCRKYSIDPMNDLIPVVPAAHYSMGGVQTDMSGKTRVPGLFVVGEAANTGVHGANRLASNSLLEGLVVANRLAEHLENLPEQQEPVSAKSNGELISGELRRSINQITTTGAGAIRDEDGLKNTLKELELLVSEKTKEGSTQAWEATNLFTVSTFIASAALMRQESRGAHWRQDFPKKDDKNWQVRIKGEIEDGQIKLTTQTIAQ
ncbi:MAG: L-aspartate oxidase [Candidatus Nanopelagicales bacterium]